ISFSNKPKRTHACVRGVLAPCSSRGWSRSTPPQEADSCLPPRSPDADRIQANRRLVENLGGIVQGTHYAFRATPFSLALALRALPSTNSHPFTRTELWANRAAVPN